MIDLTGYEKARARTPGEYRKLPADGYICRIVDCFITKSKAGNDMLVLYLDIADGAFKHYFSDAVARARSYGRNVAWDSNGIYRQLIFDNSEKVSDYFKGLLDCFEKSNPAFQFNPHAFDEKKMCGLNIGFIFAEEENEYRGKILTKVVPRIPKNVADIREGKFVVPALKKLATTPPSYGSKDDFDGVKIDESDIPF